MRSSSVSASGTVACYDIMPVSHCPTWLVQSSVLLLHEEQSLVLCS